MSATTKSQADPLVPLLPIQTMLDCSIPALRQISLSRSAPPPLLPLAVGKSTQRKLSPSTEIHQLSQANVSNVELIHQACYQDPADDTDEDLSKVPEDYS